MGGGARYMPPSERDFTLKACIYVPVIVLFLVMGVAAIVESCVGTAEAQDDYDEDAALQDIADHAHEFHGEPRVCPRGFTSELQEDELECIRDEAPIFLTCDDLTAQYAMVRVRVFLPNGEESWEPIWLNTDNYRIQVRRIFPDMCEWSDARKGDEKP